VTAKDVAALFVASELPRDQLNRIWQQADTEKARKLQFTQFCVAMELLEAAQSKAKPPQPAPAAAQSIGTHQAPAAVPRTVVETQQPPSGGRRQQREPMHEPSRQSCGPEVSLEPRQQELQAAVGWCVAQLMKEQTELSETQTSLCSTDRQLASLVRLAEREVNVPCDHTAAVELWGRCSWVVQETVN
jgi:hypothetical protein